MLQSSVSFQRVFILFLVSYSSLSFVILRYRFPYWVWVFFCLFFHNFFLFKSQNCVSRVCLHLGPILELSQWQHGLRMRDDQVQCFQYYNLDAVKINWNLNKQNPGLKPMVIIIFYQTTHTETSSESVCTFPLNYNAWISKGTSSLDLECFGPFILKSYNVRSCPVLVLTSRGTRNIRLESCEKRDAGLGVGARRWLNPEPHFKGTSFQLFLGCSYSFYNTD